jgi:hypothetical protein
MIRLVCQVHSSYGVELCGLPRFFERVAMIWMVTYSPAPVPFIVHPSKATALEKAPHRATEWVLLRDSGLSRMGIGVP